MHLSCQSVKTLDRFSCLGNQLRLSEVYWCPGLQFYSKERPILNYPIEVKTIIVIKWIYGYWSLALRPWYTCLNWVCQHVYDILNKKSQVKMLSVLLTFRQIRMHVYLQSDIGYIVFYQHSGPWKNYCDVYFWGPSRFDHSWIGIKGCLNWGKKFLNCEKKVLRIGSFHLISTEGSHLTVSEWPEKNLEWSFITIDDKSQVLESYL